MATDTLLAITDFMGGAITTTGATGTDTITDTHTVTSITIDPTTGDTVTGDDTTATVTEISEAG